MDNVNDEIKKIVNDNEHLINKLVAHQKRRLKQLSSVKEFSRSLNLGGVGGDVDSRKARSVLFQRRKSKADELSNGKEKPNLTTNDKDNSNSNKNNVGKGSDKKTFNSRASTTTTAKKDNKDSINNLQQQKQESEDESNQDSERNIRNDYCQHFVDSEKRPQNFIRDTELSQRFDEYPKLKELTKMKNALVANRATPPTYLKADLRTFDFKSLGAKFDVILIDPPLEEYCRRSPLIAGNNPDYLTYNELANLKIEDAAANPSFIFIWSGDSDGLDRGRQLLLKWGYRRCEDIVWIKTNKKCEGSRFIEPRSVFQHTKEHCIMGIKGTVRRSTDGHFIHCNVDTDVIISEEPPFGSSAKPEELYHIIEHFCLGRRRLELFGEDHNIRPGWLTIGLGLSSSNFDPQTYASYFTEHDGYLLGSTADIENLRPKSPPIRDASTPKPALPGTVKSKPKKSNAANILPILSQMSQPPPPSMQPPQILPPPFPHRWLPTMDGNIYGK